MAATTPALLHRHGTPGTWGNLGLWPAADYASACTALARLVGAAARLGRGQRVLSLASGAGDELALWREAFGVAQAVGTERDTGPAPAGPFDAVVCVDAAYHFSPRTAFIGLARSRLRSGGRLAFTDLVRDGRAGGLLHGAARLCGLDGGDVASADGRRRQLADAGFVDVAAERLDAAVLDGFVQFVRAQRRRLGAEAAGPGWRRVAVTAALIPPCRALGLGYALFSARKP